MLSKEHTELYGRYDPVTIQRQHLKVIKSFRRKYEISDSLVAKYGTIKEEIMED